LNFWLVCWLTLSSSSSSAAAQQHSSHVKSMQGTEKTVQAGAPNASAEHQPTCQMHVAAWRFCRVVAFSICWPLAVPARAALAAHTYQGIQQTDCNAPHRSGLGHMKLNACKEAALACCIHIKGPW
jgi:hypothetical protein